MRFNGTCQIKNFLHKGNTLGGKTAASELGARQCGVGTREKTFCVKPYILTKSLHETRRRFLSKSIRTIGSWNLPLGASWYRNGSTSFAILGEWIKVNYPGNVGPLNNRSPSSKLPPPSSRARKAVYSASGTVAEHRQYDCAKDDEEIFLIDFIFHMKTDFVFLHHHSFIHSSDSAKDHEGIFYRFFFLTWTHILSFFMILRRAPLLMSSACARCRMDLFGLCWTEAATYSMVTCCLVVWRCPGDLFLYTPKISKLADPLLYQLAPRGKFQLPIS